MPKTLRDAATRTTDAAVQNSGDTPAASSRGRGRPRTIDGPDICQQCQRIGARLPRHRFCPACVSDLHQQVVTWRERDYLWRWLACRNEVKPTDAEWRTVVRLRASAERIGLDWRKPPVPGMLTDDQRLARLSERAPRKPPVRRAKKASDAA